MGFDIKNFDFPKTGIFSDINVDKDMLNHARELGFDKHYNPYHSLFSDLFFNGGKLNFKKDLDLNFKSKAVPYLKALMQSFQPKHEDKTCVCAYLLSELVDL